MIDMTGVEFAVHVDAVRKPYLAIVILTVGAHFAYLAYLPSGGFLALRWRRSIWFHVPAVLWGAAVVLLGLPCPLTSVESWARAHAAMDPLPVGGFVERYVAGAFYPSNRTSTAQTMAFLAAVTSWSLFACSTRRPRRAVSVAMAALSEMWTTDSKADQALVKTDATL